jgi:hypothetical protein
VKNILIEQGTEGLLLRATHHICHIPKIEVKEGGEVWEKEHKLDKFAVTIVSSPSFSFIYLPLPVFILFILVKQLYDRKAQLEVVY